MTNSIAIVIADDHAVLRDSLAALLQSEPNFAVVGAAANGQEALQLVQERHPDVLVLDLFMPQSDGFEVLRTLDRAGNRVAAVVLTGSNNNNDFVQVVRLGARGLVLKGDDPQTLFAAIRMLAEGELAFSSEVAESVLNSMASDKPPVPASLGRLSDRERQISYLVARGMKNRDIATDLKISENTVKRHLQSIFSKTGSRDRLDLTLLTLNESSKAA
jgi:DNA-binding NarL/FixJ family response regulator